MSDAYREEMTRAHALQLTTAEARAVRALERLAAQWPATLWLFSADGMLYVMRTGATGERVYDEARGVDRGYIQTAVRIPSDGGDW